MTSFPLIFRFIIYSNIAVAVAGITSDANILINYARKQAQSHLLTYGEPLPCEHLAQRLCDLKQGYTQYGGLRPFGVSFLYAGWDNLYGYQLYHSDPSGNYFGWKAHCIGANHSSAQSLLKQEYKEDMSLEEASALTVKVLKKTMENTALSSEKLEIAILKKEENENLKLHMLSPQEIDALLEEHKQDE